MPRQRPLPARGRDLVALARFPSLSLLIRARVEGNPSRESKKPVSRQHEVDFARFYGADEHALHEHGRMLGYRDRAEEAWRFWPTAARRISVRALPP